MSKICRDTFEPQTFAQLEILTNWLERETSSLQQDFQRKCECLNERQATLNYNENQLLKIDELVKTLQSNVSSVEDEIQQLECNLHVWEVTINNIALLQGIDICNCPCRVTFKSERVMFMEMMQETDAKVKQLQTCLSDMEVLRKCCIRRPYPYDMIFRILDCHYETLRNIDKQLDLIMDKLLIVTSSNCST